MPATEAQIAANRANAARSTGPRTEEGKARSRANALKHGLTGEGVVLPEADVDEVERLSRAFREELRAPGEAGRVLARRLAVLAVRMDRAAEQEDAAIAERVLRALDEFEAPEGADAGQAERLRAIAGARATFDPSDEATLARKYEAAAERGFFRALKELRQLKEGSGLDRGKAEPAQGEASKMAAEARSSIARLGSFLPGGPTPSPTAPAPRPAPPKPPPAPARGPVATWDPFAAPSPAAFDVPIAIGRAR